VADRSPVIGYAPGAEGFFWLAGQGGHGIQIAPATARLAAALLRGESPPEDLLRLGLEPTAISPARLAAV
jgi:D-arginine dehydrogenase